MTTTHIIPSKFALGQVVATSALISALEEAGTDPTATILSMIERHALGDWGDLDSSDKAMNEQAMNPKLPLRILSRYTVDEIDCYVITEWDRSHTTIMRVQDY